MELKDSAQRLQKLSENMFSAGLSARVAVHSMDASEAQLVEMGMSLSSALGSPPGSDARSASLVQFNTQHR